MVIKKKNASFMNALIVKLTFRKRQLNCPLSLSRPFRMGGIEFGGLRGPNKNQTTIIMSNICWGLRMFQELFQMSHMY